MKVIVCWRLMTIKIQQEQKQFAALEEIHKGATKRLYNKLTGMMVGQCFKTITANRAKEFMGLLMSNRTDIDVSPYVPVNFKYFENPNADLELTKEEKFTLKLITKV